MEFKTCEEYVLAELKAVTDERDELKGENSTLKIKLNFAENKVEMLERELDRWGEADGQ